MKTITNFILIGLLFFVFISCQTNTEKLTPLPYYNTADFTPTWVPQASAQSNILHQIAPFSFNNQLGKQVDNSSLEGKIYAANFFFTICPSICLKMTDNLHLVQEAFKDDEEVMLVSHSVMPWVDSIPKLYDYAQAKDIMPEKWHLLTGNKAEIYDLARNSYFAEKEIGVQKNTNSFLHTENVVLIDKSGHIRGIYNATLPLEVKRLIEDIKLLKKTG